MKISACLIIKNEEKNLRQYIEGVKDIADEIIIADTGSTDNSLKLLEELKAKYKLNLTVCFFEWINNFAAAKNFALSKATGDWIIFLDADEYFDKKDRKKIRPFLEFVGDDKKVLGVSTPLLNVDIYNNNEPISKSKQIRLFRNQENLKFTGAIHEHLWYKGSSSIIFLNMDFLIIHTGYSPQLHDEKQKRNNEIILANKELAAKDSPTYFSYLAVALAAEGKIAEAEENLKRAIKFMKKNNDFFLVNSYDLYLNTKKHQKVSKEEIGKIIEDGIESTNSHPDMLAQKLVFVMDSDNPNLEEAKNISKEIIIKSEDKKLRSKYLNQTDALLPYVHYTLGAIYKLEKNLKEAENEYLIALKSYRYREDILGEILSIYDDDDKKIIKLLREYYNEKSEDDKKFLAKVFEARPRNNLYKKYSKTNVKSVDYKLASGKITEAIKQAANELENAKKANLPQEEFKQNLREKLYMLAIAFFFLDINEIGKVEKELNLLPPSIIAVILRFYGEELPRVDGEEASYNAIMNMAKTYLPKEKRERFLNLY